MSHAQEVSLGTSRPAGMTSAPAAPARDRDDMMAGQLRAWLDALADISRVVNQAPPLDDLLRMIVRTTRHLTAYDSCAIMMRDETGEALAIRGSSGLSDAYVQELNEHHPMVLRPGEQCDGPSSRAFRTLRPVVLADLLSDPSCGPWEPVITEQGVQSLLSVPLVSGGRPLGVLNCYTSTRHTFSAQEVMLMETIANQIAIAIEQASLRAQEQARITELLALNQQLEARRAATERAETLHNDLMRILLAGEGPTAITCALAHALRCRVVLEDDDGRRPAAADPDGHALPDMFPTVYANRAEAAAIRARSTTERRAIEVPANATAGDGYPGMVSPVVLDGELIGHLWALDPTDAFDQVDLRSLERGVVLIALAISRIRTAQEVEWRLSRDVLDDLIGQGPDADVSALAARAHHLSVDLDAPHTLLVARPDPHVAESGDSPGSQTRLNRSFLNQVQRVMDAVHPNVLVASRTDHVVVLWPEQGAPCTAAGMGERIRSEVCCYMPVASVSVALSDPCRSVTAYPEAYRVTLAALGLMQAAGRRDRVVRLQDLGLNRLLLEVRDPARVLDFAAHTLEPLRTYDRTHNAELTATLRTFLESGCGAGLTASRLIVHPNTVTYRLRRIAELLDVNPRDPHVLLEFALAFAVEKVLDSQLDARN